MSWLTGDSGYPLQPFFMTPFENLVEGSPQHITVRHCVESCIGVLQMKF